MTSKRVLSGFLEYLLASGAALLLLLVGYRILERAEFIPDIFDLFFLPGFFAALAFFPGGIDSLHPEAYLASAFLINSLLYGWPLLWFWKMAVRFRRKRYS